jgi:hypothetical protein
MPANRKANGDQSVMLDDTMTGEVTGPTPFQLMLRAMESDATMAAEDDGFSGDDLNAILSAETEEEMFDAADRGALNLQNLAGTELQLMDITVKYSRGESDIATPFQVPARDGEPAKKMYLLVTACRISDIQDNGLMRLPKVGEVFTFNTSARQSTAELWWLYTHGKVDASNGVSYQVFVKSVPLDGGKAVIKLKRIQGRSVQASAPF